MTLAVLQRLGLRVATHRIQSSLPRSPPRLRSSKGASRCSCPASALLCWHTVQTARLFSSYRHSTVSDPPHSSLSPPLFPRLPDRMYPLASSRLVLSLHPPNLNLCSSFLVLCLPIILLLSLCSPSHIPLVAVLRPRPAVLLLLGLEPSFFRLQLYPSNQHRVVCLFFFFGSLRM